MVATRWGRIINISSTSGISGGTSGIHYAATKGGVIALSRALAKEVAAHGVTVNVIAPSKIETDMFRTSVKPEDRQKVVEKIPVGRLGQPEDIAEAAAYFAAEEAGYVTGQTLVVSGGY
jgi:3-oxoacyl-[acyl-carrier protein] reductase